MSLSNLMTRRKSIVVSLTLIFIFASVVFTGLRTPAVG